MSWENGNASAGEIADRIAGLQAEELQSFLRGQLRSRNLHKVVANLNAAALSDDAPRSTQARAALKKLGFAD